MDAYAHMADVRKSFADFVNKVPFYGASVLCLDDPHVQAVIPEVVRRRITYGLSAQADIAAREVRYDKQFGSVYQARLMGEPVGEVTLHVPGLHNIYNSLAAIAIGLELEVPFETISKALGVPMNSNQPVGTQDLSYWQSRGVTIADMFDENGQLKPGWTRTERGYDRTGGAAPTPTTSTPPPTADYTGYTNYTGYPTGGGGMEGMYPAGGGGGGAWPGYTAPDYLDPGEFDPGPASGAIRSASIRRRGPGAPMLNRRPRSPGASGSGAAGRSAFASSSIASSCRPLRPCRPRRPA
jgi:hypothetical protein